MTEFDDAFKNGYLGLPTNATRDDRLRAVRERIRRTTNFFIFSLTVGSVGIFANIILLLSNGFTLISSGVSFFCSCALLVFALYWHSMINFWRRFQV